MERSLNKDNLTFFNNNGWVVERNIFSISEINTIKEKINIFLKKKYVGV